ncbi:hypothetical protein Ddye_007853 [Dipteronia dyeriana]|uniref:Uncharacterized protein n=1 Tax=Dipteronia dyeriana TaxID=168575 RepID=A0AAD9XKU2_9ROSI|nr:hypothetical protein Ddye_007853 [Dipteronia dyeriana]
MEILIEVCKETPGAVDHSFFYVVLHVLIRDIPVSVWYYFFFPAIPGVLTIVFEIFAVDLCSGTCPNCGYTCDVSILWLVQQLIAGSPNLLLDDSAYLGKASLKASFAKKFTSEYVVKPLPHIVKCKDDSEKPKHNIECSAENVVGKHHCFL